MNSRLMEYFKSGGVFLFDENKRQSEETYYKVEELMGEVEGESISETEVIGNEQLCLFYDESVIDENTAKEKYVRGDYVNSLAEIKGR